MEDNVSTIRTYIRSRLLWYSLFNQYARAALFYACVHNVRCHTWLTYAETTFWQTGEHCTAVKFPTNSTSRRRNAISPFRYYDRLRRMRFRPLFSVFFFFHFTRYVARRYNFSVSIPFRRCRDLGEIQSFRISGKNSARTVGMRNFRRNFCFECSLTLTFYFVIILSSTEIKPQLITN